MKDKQTILNDLLKEHPIHELIKFSELNLSEKLQENTEMIVKYRDLYHQELAKLDYINDMYDKLAAERYRYYRFECEDAWTKTAEIEKYCFPRDEKLIKFKNIVRKQEVRVRFFELCWKSFEKQQWSMKLFMETLKPY